MAKYGEFVYGSGTLYGDGEEVVTIPAVDGTIQWIVQIDWLGTGYTGENEAQWLVDCQIRRGKEYVVAPSATAFERLSPGTATLTFENINGRYDPYVNSNIQPGRKVWIAVNIVATGTVKTVFTGHITDIQPISGENRVTITVADGVQWLTDQNITIPAMMRTTISDAIKGVLSKALYPWPQDIGDYAQPIVIFDPDKIVAYDAIADLENASIGTFFVAKDGIAKFYPCTYTPAVTHTLVQSDLLKTIMLRQPWETVRNDITVTAVRRAKLVLSTIWRSVSVIAVASGSSKVITAEYPKSADISPANNILDYKAYNASSGGSDITAYFQVELSEITSKSAKLTITNSGGVTGYITFLRIRGCAYTQSIVSFNQTDATSKLTYGPRRFSLDMPWLQDQGFAETYAADLLAFLKDPQKNPAIQIEAREDIQFDYELLDYVDLDVDQLSIDAVYQIGGIEYTWQNETGQGVVTTLYLQKVIHLDTIPTADPYYPGIDPIPEEGPGSVNWDKYLDLSPGNVPIWDIPETSPYTWPTADNQRGLPFGISIIIGGTSIETGICAYIQVPYNCIISDCVVVGDIAGTLQLDIHKSDYNNLTPSGGNSICGWFMPELLNTDKATISLTGWSPNLTKGDWLTIYVDSVAGIKLATLALSGVTV